MPPLAQWADQRRSPYPAPVAEVRFDSTESPDTGLQEDTPTIQLGVFLMSWRKLAWVGVCLGVAMAKPMPVEAQTGCTASQNAAVQCFIGNAVKTNLLTLHFGMTLAQFKAYGVSVSKILQDQETYLVLLGMTSAVADAMPATNADGSANSPAQDAALTSIVNAAVADGLATVPANSTQQDLVYFSEDLVSGMGTSQALMLSPGTMLRVIDSYVVNNTSNGVVNWTQVNSTLASMVGNLSMLGLLKLPPGVTLAQAQAFTQSLAQTIYTYKTATGRATL